jgi:hypothetical protein
VVRLPQQASDLALEGIVGDVELLEQSPPRGVAERRRDDVHLPGREPTLVRELVQERREPLVGDPLEGHGTAHEADERRLRGGLDDELRAERVGLVDAVSVVHPGQHEDGQEREALTHVANDRRGPSRPGAPGRRPSRSTPPSPRSAASPRGPRAGDLRRRWRWISRAMLSAA